MCGRYGFVPGEKFYKRFEVDNILPDLKPRYNVSPSQDMPVITKHSPNQVILMRWGMIPFWAKDPAIGNKMINARAETVFSKPAFRKAFISQRCVVPASGFYEWKKAEVKIPYFIRMKNKDLFGFAGLYDIWKDPGGKEIESYTIITTEANRIVGNIHTRMPVILKREDEKKWLNPDESEIDVLKEFLIPYPDDKMEAYPVSPSVNNPGNDLIEVMKPQEIPQENPTLF